jgi:hypothetical protein
MRRREPTSSFQEERLTPLRIADRVQAGFISFNSPGGFEARMADIARALASEDLRMQRRLLHQERKLASFSLSTQSLFAATSSRAAADGSVTLRLTKYSPVFFSTSGEDAR